MTELQFWYELFFQGAIFRVPTLHLKD